MNDTLETSAPPLDESAKGCRPSSPCSAIDGLVKQLHAEMLKMKKKPQHTNDWTDGWIAGQLHAYKHAEKLALKCSPNVQGEEREDDDEIACNRCGGEGRVPVHEYHAVMDEMWRTCPDCHGSVEGCSR